MADASAPSTSERPVLLVPALVIGVASFAFSAILVRWAGEAPALTIAVWRTGLAALFLLPVAVPVAGAEMRRLTWREWGLIGAAGVVLGLHFVAFIESLFYTTVASATVLVTTSPIILAVLGYVVLGERLARRRQLAVGVGVAGALLLGWGDLGGDATRPLIGNALAFGAAVLVSIYLLIGRVVRRKRSWLAYLFPLYTVVALTTLVVAAVRGAPLLGFSATFYGLCALMALGPSLIGHGSFNYALRYLPAAVVGLLALVEPVGASILAYAFFAEQPGLLALVGMTLVLGSVAVALWPARRRPPSEP
ncbi:MAG: EamA family transporter [Bacteroidetes bacterium]|jgi:drug/metabolite transporter (DMT)-like permease|nr:EamA family transporter [Bacteroidota bacterium]